MTKNLRFYSLVAALATAYSVTPGLVWADCPNCNYADFFLYAYYNDPYGYDYASSYGSLPISTSYANDVCAQMESNDGGNFESPDAYNICIEALRTGSDSEWCYASCEQYQCDTQTCAGDYDCDMFGYSTCNNGCCSDSGGGGGGGNDPVTPSDPHGSCSGSESHWLLVYASSTVSAQSVFDSYCTGTLTGNPTLYGTDASAITQSHCTQLGDNFRIIDWCSQTICSGDIAESSNYVRSCNQCASGYTRVEIGTLFGYDRYSYISDDAGSWPWAWNEDVSSDEPQLHPFYVCVKCEYTGSTSWSSYDSNRVRRYVPVCSASANTYQYACKASRCATNSYKTSSLSCASRCSFPYTSCASSDGHWTQCSCQWSNGAYSTDMEGNGTTCAACPTPTSIYTGTSGTTVPGTHAPSASGSANACYVNSGTYHDTTGYWTYSSSCNYSGS